MRCRVVMDKAAGKPKGTAFVEFKTEEAAKRAAEACSRGRCVLHRLLLWGIIRSGCWSVARGLPTNAPHVTGGVGSVGF